MSSAEQNPSTENWLVVVGALDPSVLRTSLQLDSGRIVSIDDKSLASRADDAICLEKEPRA